MKESTQALAAYTTYRDMGPTRSQEAVAKQLAKSRQLISRWSAAHHWQERIAAYECEIAAEAEERAKADRVRQLEQMRKAQEMLGVELQNIGIKAARRKAEKDQIGAYAAVQMVTAGAELQRRAMGEPDQKHEISGKDGGAIEVKQTRSLAGLTDEELSDLERLVSRLANAGEHSG